MKARLFSLMTLLVLLAGLFPTTAVLADGNDGNYEFQGTIEAPLPADIHNGVWTVSGRTVRVTNATQIDQEHGPVAVGAYVEVKGWLQGDGSVDATKIDVKSSPGGGGGDDNGYLKYYGTVESLPAGLIGDWVVSGRTIHVTATTQIEQEHGAVAVNAYVEVKGSQRADTSIDASKIEVKMGAGSGDSGRSYTQFNGAVSAMPNGLVGNWTIGGRTVHVDAATRFEQEHGLATVGANVEVKGWLEADSSITAVKIEVKDNSGGDSGGGSGSGSVQDKFHGTVQQLPAGGGLIGAWIVSGRTVNVSNSTRIDQEHGQPVAGAYVEVEGLLQADNSVNATKIDVQDSPEGGDNHDSNTKFYGTVNSFPAGFVGTWDIGGRIVTTTATTEINQEHGAVAVDAYVEVEGTLQADGSVAATKIEVKSGPGTGGGSSVGYTKFYGVIESLPATGLTGDWQVSTRTVHVSATTRIDQEHGAVRMGASVEVKGIQETDGSVTATKIEVKN